MGDCCSLGWPYVLFLFCLFVILVISRFGFECWIWAMIASVPDLFHYLKKLVPDVTYQVLVEIDRSTGSGKDF